MRGAGEASGGKGAGVVRYDAAIIGAGGEGLAAAIVLADAGLSVVVVERAAAPGGRFVTREFHPGFRASPFCDSPAPIPPALFHALGLARHGTMIAPAPATVALWPEGYTTIGRGESQAAAALLEEGRRTREAVLARAARAAATVAPRLRLAPRRPAQAWPGEDWALRSLAGLAADCTANPHLAGHLAASILDGRSADPFLAGSALHLLAAGDGGSVAGGLGRLGAALSARAVEAGAEIRCGLEVTALHRGKRGLCGVTLADGSEIATRAVVSTLDLKQTVLSFSAWTDLPADLVARAGHYRMGAGSARVLFALDAPPALPPFARRCPLHVMPGLDLPAEADAACRAGLLAEKLPMTLRLVSADDPQLAPTGRAVLTASLAAVPHRLFDGAWTHEKRELLRSRALDAIEAVLPGLSQRVLAAQVLAPPDIEEALGATGGDLWGGEIAPDQMLARRPAQRAPIARLYLAGGSTAAGAGASCASGVYAAHALLFDMRAGRLP